MQHTFRISGFADEASPSLEGQIRVLRQERMEWIDLRVVDGRNVVDLTDEALAEAARRLEAAGIRVSCIASPVGKIPFDAPIGPEVERLRRAIAAAQRLGTPYVRIFSFFLPQAEADALAGPVLERVEAFVRAAEGTGVRLLHENEKGIFGDTAARCLQLHRTFGDALGAIFDPANFLQCGERPWEAFEALAPYVEYMHIKDARLGQMEVVPAGMGDGRLADILRQLAARDGLVLSLEPHLAASPWMEQIMARERIPRAAAGSVQPEELFSLAHRALEKLLSA